MSYTTLREEVAMLKSHGVTAPVASAALTATELLRLQSIAEKIFVEDDLYEYIVRLVAFTRSNRDVVLGASPRACLALLRCAKSRSLIEGRTFLTPDDVRAVAPAVLEHRLILVPELEGDADARSRIVADAIAKVPYRKAVRPT
jgi:MoxR-like ATPase